MIFISCKKVETTEVSQKSDLNVMVASDLHYLSESLHDDGEAFKIFSNARDGKEVKYITTVIKSFVEEVKAAKPDILILSGDLTLNGEKQSHIELAEMLGTIPDTKIYVIPGNHDINNVHARSFKDDKQIKTPYISDSDFKSIYEKFGFSAATSFDKDSLSYLVKATDKQWFLMIDSCKYQNNVSLGMPQTGGGMRTSTCDWIKKCGEMARAENAKIIAVTHHNLIDHNDMLNEDFTMEYNQKIVDSYADAGIFLNLSGHIHAQEIAKYENIYDIASSALCSYPHQYGRININERTLDYKTVKLDVSSYAKKMGITDPNLLNYTEYAKQRFSNAMRSLPSMGEDLTETERQEMISVFREMNMRFFAGEPRTDLINSNGFKLLAKEGGFIPLYAESMAKDDGIPDQELKIEFKK